MSEMAEMINRRRMNKILRYIGREMLMDGVPKFVRIVDVLHRYKGLNRNKKVVTEWTVDVQVSDTIESEPFYCTPTSLKVIKMKHIRKEEGVKVV